MQGGESREGGRKGWKRSTFFLFSFFSTSHLSKSKKGVDILCKETILLQSANQYLWWEHFTLSLLLTQLWPLWLSSFLRPFYPPNISQYGYNLGNLKKGIGVLCNETFQLLWFLCFIRALSSLKLKRRVGILCKGTLSLRFSSFFFLSRTCTLLPLSYFASDPFLLLPLHLHLSLPQPVFFKCSSACIIWKFAGVSQLAQKLYENGSVISWLLYRRAFLLFKSAYCTFYKRHRSPLFHISHVSSLQKVQHQIFRFRIKSFH